MEECCWLDGWKGVMGRDGDGGKKTDRGVEKDPPERPTQLGEESVHRALILHLFFNYGLF